jgi:hypothetical protein
MVLALGIEQGLRLDKEKKIIRQYYLSTRLEYLREKEI